MTHRILKALPGACLAAWATVMAIALLWGRPAAAAAFAGACCADLEERIAELEATTARKGNRKVALTLTGHINRAVLFWDDGVESDAYSVGNKNDQTNVSFEGDAQLAPDWRAGYVLTLRIEDNLSDGVDQISSSAGDGFQIWKSHWFIESAILGRFALGRESRVSDTAPETDFSETGVAAYAGVQDVGGGFLVRRSDGALAGVTWGDLGNHFNGDTTDLVRWDSSELAGFVVSASWGSDDIWDVGLRYAGQSGGWRFEAAVAYTEVTDAPSDFADVDHSTLVGSASLLHEPSGLNATIAAGERQFDALAEDADGVARTPADARFIYVKLGWIVSGLTSLGPTAFYGEYGRFRDFLTVTADPDLVASLEAGAGTAARISGSERDVWGFGVVQHIERAEMQLYIGYRHHDGDLDLRDNAGAVVPTRGLESFDTVIGGAVIAF